MLSSIPESLQLCEAAKRLSTCVLYGYRNFAILLHPGVLELQKEFRNDGIATALPFLPLLQT